MRPDEDTLIEALYREHFQKLWHYAKASLRDPELASEVVQDVFHDAVRYIDRLRCHENPAGWLRVVLRNKLMHVRRDRDQYLRCFISLDTDLADPDRSPLLADDGIRLPPLPEIMEEIRRLLSPEDWALFRQIVIEERPYKETARQLNKSVWACQKRIQRIREKLRDHFAENF